MYKNKMLLVFLVVLAILIAGIGVGVVSADEPGTEGPVLVVTHEDGTPVCEDWCSTMSCVFPVTSERVLPANEAIRWWSGCRCVPLEGPPHIVCICPEKSFCERTREADFLGWIYGGQFYPGGFVGKYEGANDLAIARFRLAGVPVGEIEKAVISLDGVQTDELGDACGDAVFRIDLLSYALSYTWGGNWNYWNYVQDYLVLSSIYEVSAQYLRAVTDEEGHVPTIGFRLSDEQVSGLEEAVARARTDSRWSMFVRVTLANPPEVGDCVLKFQDVLLTIIPE